MSATGSTAPRTIAPGARGWILAATILGSSIIQIDSTVVNVAMPVVQRSLSVGLDKVQWVIVAYTLFVTSLMLIGGALGDRYGRRKIFSLGLTIFTLTSIWCGAAPNIDQLIIARALQGVGGALLVPGSLAIITSCFSGADRGRAIGTWSGLSAVSTAIGPLLGGWLVDNVSWRAVFYINAPLGAAVLWMAMRHVPESRDEDAPARLDWPGAAVAAIGFGTLVYGLITANVRGFGDGTVIGLLAAGALLLVLFVVIEARSRAPMMPLGLFRSLDFSGSNLLTLLLYAPLSAMFFMLGINLIQVQGYSATLTGAALLPFIILIATLSRFAGAYAGRNGARLPMVVGPLLTAIGYVMLSGASVGGSYWTDFLPGISVAGLGMACAIAPLTSTVMNAVASHQAGTASGINNAVSWLAGLLAVAVVGIVAISVFGDGLTRRLPTLQLPSEAHGAIMAQRGKLAAMDLPASLPPALHAPVRAAINESFIDAFRVVLRGCAVLAALSGLAAFLTIGRGRAPADR